MIQSPSILLASTALLVGVLFSASAFSQQMPLGFDRALERVEVPTHALTLEQDETASFDTTGVARITIGSTAIISKDYDEQQKRFTVTAGEAGVTMLRVFRKDGSEVWIEVTVRAAND